VTEDSSQELALTSDMETGLEEFDQTDMVIPRLQILHKEGRFRDTLTNEEFAPLERAILLGLVKQRILWHSTVDDGDLPMCKSPDHNTGYPNVDEDTKKDKRFPWDLSGFKQSDFSGDQPQLPCEGCKLKEWETHPDGKKPYCAEVYQLPLMYAPNEDSDLWIPAIVAFSKTGLKTLRNYLSGFQRRQAPLFSAVTRVELELNKRGGNIFSTPKFTKVDDIPQADWREHSLNFSSMKAFLQRPPREFEDEGGPAPSDNTARPPEQPSQQAAPPPEEPASTETPPAEDKNKLPF